MLAHKGTQTLHTDRLTLRKFVISDTTYMFRNYATDSRVTKFLSWTPYVKEEDIRPFLSEVIADYVEPNSYHWAIELAGEVVGSISTLSVDEKNHSCEVGYCLGHDYWNKGITTEALAAVMDFLFREVGMHRVMAKHDVENPASGKVMAKCGMTYEGTLKEHYRRHDGTYSDACVYGKVN